ncbi:MAG: isochorismatase family protein [Candidatus Hodarchaeales archaeon]
MKLKNTAIIVVDMQYGNFIGAASISQGELLLENTIKILFNGRKLSLPIIFVQNMGGKGDPDEPNKAGWEIHPKLQVSENDHIIQKATPDAFHKTQLINVLSDLNSDHLIILGLQTEYCIDTTIRRASSLGFQATLVADCHSTWDSDILSASLIINHHNQVLNGFFAQLITTEELCTSLAKKNDV